ncbi:MAG: glycine--tRNA ligase subunit beta [Rhodospirillaceae bacterium]|nr:glycine--tRNA ligase subunit beta [Rhodospirillaceae bacterium]
MPELLLEILSEEIPARMQAKAADDLKRLVCDGLKKAGLEFSNAEAYVTPRRLALVVDGIPEKQPDISEERRGPSVDAPDKAIQGFLGSVGMTMDEVETRQTEKGMFLFAKIEKQGRLATDVLMEVLPAALSALPWPKSMRWPRFDQRWVRPIHSMIGLFAGGEVPFPWGAAVAGNVTSGHRFLAPDAITVSDCADYKSELAAAKVMLDPNERRDLILAEATKLAEAEGLTLKDDQGLLNEVTGLVEWPVVYMGSIDDDFMEVPAEVLITSMKSHQKYFSCLDAAGNLANRFIVVANTETTDAGAQVVAGNERVLRARLSDAKFFWDQDRKTSLAAKAPALKDRVFHAKLGTMDEKVDRMQALAADIASHVNGADKDRVRSASRLAKADLSSGMVGEFPELQGIIGRYYAVHDGESDEVADAIAEHYAPQGPGDACPTKPVSICVSLADKIDSLVGFFAIDEKPTGSKDPFALRRAALGVIRLILENRVRLPLSKSFETARGLHEVSADPSEDLLAFFADRLKVHLKEQGTSHDHIDAVFALGGEDDLVRLLARVDALKDFLFTDDGENLLTAYSRAANILKIEEKKDGKAYGGDADAALFDQDEEKALAGGLSDAGPAIAKAVESEDFAGAMKAVAALRGPVDAFFDKVTVNCDDAGLRENRLKLLNGIRTALEGVADFSKIEG